MKYRINTSNLRRQKHRRTVFLSAAAVLILSSGLAVFIGAQRTEIKTGQQTVSESLGVQTISSESINTADALNRLNPLKGRSLYSDDMSNVDLRLKTFEQNGDLEGARLLRKIAEQPAAIWLLGPTQSDPGAERDFKELKRTSTSAKANNSVPVYQLYAIPIRDACAVYSAGGFQDNSQYQSWLDKVIVTLETEAVFMVEADAVSQTINNPCLSDIQKQLRFELLASTVKKLSESPKVIGVYLDAGHPEWFPDSSDLVEPLKLSGVSYADGIIVNVSNFVATDIAVQWSLGLTKQLGFSQGVVIDTSRNGRGAVQSGEGEQRWCNPRGRGLGNTPTTDTGINGIDAFMWVKAPGESDGSCFGYPPAGSFTDEIALELSRNAL